MSKCLSYLIVQESELNLRGLVPGTRVDWIGKDWIGKDRIIKDWIRNDWIGKESNGLEKI